MGNLEEVRSWEVPLPRCSAQTMRLTRVSTSLGLIGGRMHNFKRDLWKSTTFMGRGVEEIRRQDRLKGVHGHLRCL